MDNHVKSVQLDDVDERLAKLVDDLIVDSDKESEKFVENMIMELINAKDRPIPSLDDVLQPLIDINDCIIEEIVRTLVFYEKESIMECDKGVPSGKRCVVCDDFHECYEDLSTDIRFNEFPDCDDCHLGYLVQYTLMKKGFSIYINRCDHYTFPDFVMHFDYDNESILSDFFDSRPTEIDKKLVIINHAQQMMFPELLVEEDSSDGSCYNYGKNFALMFDNYNIKEKQLTLKEGGS